MVTAFTMEKLLFMYRRASTLRWLEQYFTADRLIHGGSGAHSTIRIINDQCVCLLAHLTAPCPDDSSEKESRAGVRWSSNRGISEPETTMQRRNKLHNADEETSSAPSYRI